MKSSDNNISIKKVDRDNNIELLRIVLMFMIVLLHMISHGLDFIPSLIKETYNPKIDLFHIIAFSFSIIGVNCFVFISGFYGIKFKVSSLINFEKQAIFTSLFILVILLLLSFHNGYRFIIQSFFPVLSNYWWFLSTYILLFLLSPFINAGIEKLEKKDFQLIVILFFILNCFGGYIWGTFNSNSGYSIFNFIFLYFLARYIKIYNIESKIKFPIYIYMLFLAITIVIGYYLYNTHHFKIFLKFYDYNNPLIILSSVLFFLVFKKLKINKDVRWLSKLTFGIYLFSDNDLVRNNLLYIFKENYNIFYVIIVAITIFILSALLEFGRQTIFNLLEKK